MHPAQKLSFRLLPALLCVSAFAADEPPPDLLRGPEVTSTARSQGLPMLSSGSQLRAIKRQAVPARRWFGELAQLPLTEEQQTRFASLKKDFNERSERFKNEYGKTVSRARKELRRLEEQRDTPLQERDQTTRERIQALQVQISKIEMIAPKVEQLQLSCWELLSNEQQDLLRVRLKEIRQQLREERARREQKRREDAIRENADPMQPDAMQPDAMQETPKGSL